MEYGVLSTLISYQFDILRLIVGSRHELSDPRL
jgi:hypothetical protein